MPNNHNTRTTAPVLAGGGFHADDDTPALPKTAPERQHRGEKRRSAEGENGGRAEKKIHRAPHTPTPTTAAARAEEGKREDQKRRRAERAT